MRRTPVAVLAIFLLMGALLGLPINRSFVAKAEVSDGERLAMYSKPSVVRIIDGIAGQYTFYSPEKQTLTFNVSYIGLGSGFFISASG